MPTRPRLVVLSALFLMACVAPAGAQTAPPKVTDPTITDGSAQHALDAARASFAASGVTTYRMRVQHSCFCPPQYTMPRLLTVRRGAPVRPPASLKDVATVPRLFRTIQSAIDSGVARLDVRYGARGVPGSIAIDFDAQIADEEAYYTVDRFLPLKR